jgi:hypothetical protein
MELAMSQEFRNLHACNVQNLEIRRQHVDQGSVFRKAFVATLGGLEAIAAAQSEPFSSFSYSPPPALKSRLLGWYGRWFPALS